MFSFYGFYRNVFQTFSLDLLTERFGQRSHLPESREGNVFLALSNWVNGNNNWITILPLIRWLTINENDFMDICMAPDSFPRDTMIELAKLIVSNNHIQGMPAWMTTTRRPIPEGVTSMYRYGETRVGVWNSSPPSGSSICVGTDSPLHFHGVGLFPRTTGNFKVRLTVIDCGSGEKEAETTCIVANQASEVERRVQLPVPLRLTPNKRYRLCVVCNGGGFWSEYGDIGCKTKTICFPQSGTSVKLTFHDAPDSATTVSRGQVPIFYVSVSCRPFIS